MESKNYIVPGLTAVIMMVIAALLTSLTIAREWESGTMEQLISTPLRGIELIIGKLFPYFTIGMLDVVVAVAMAEWLFRVPLRGSVFQVFATGAIFLVVLLSGFMFPITNMPEAVQWLTFLNPLRYYLVIIRGIFLKGVGPEVLWIQMAALAALGAASLTLATRRFSKTLL